MTSAKFQETAARTTEPLEETEAGTPRLAHCWARDFLSLVCCSQAQTLGKDKTAA